MKTSGSQTDALTRRRFLQRGKNAALLAAAQSLAPFVLSGCIPTARTLSASPIKVGILHSQTGTMSISESSLIDGELLAIEEINAAGGLLGRPIEAVVEDGRSRFTDIFPKKARKLLLQDQAAVVFGCWTSVSRKAVLPVFEELNGLLFFPVPYEGNESSPNIVYTGAVANQFLLPAIDWLRSPEGGSRSRFYLIGSDGFYSHTCNYILGKLLPSKGGQVVGETCSPFGHRDYKEIVKAILKAEPDLIFSTILGDSNIAFLNELAAQGNTPDKLPVLATSVGEDELRSLIPARVKGHLGTACYFQSVSTPRNREFVRQFKLEYGADRVTGDPLVPAYSQVYLWKLAVEEAGSVDVDKVRETFRSEIEFECPSGKIKVDPKTQHTYRRFRLGKVRDDRQFDIVHESKDWIAPDPYPQVAFPGWHCDWTKGGITRGAEVKIAS